MARYSILKPDKNLSYWIDNALEKEILPLVLSIENSNKEGTGLSEYLNTYYNVLLDFHEFICSQPRQNYQLTPSAIYAVLLDVKSMVPLNENTLSTLFKMQKQCIDTGVYTYVMNFWAYLQICRYEVYKVGTKTGNIGIIQSTLKKNRQINQLQLLLGSYLLYKRKYILLREIFEYAPSYFEQSYFLLPDNITNIVKKIVVFYRDIVENRENYNTIYKFTDEDTVDGTNKNYLIENCVYEYVSLLFLRLYTLKKYPYNSGKIAFRINLPPVPSVYNEKKERYEIICRLLALTKRHLNNRESMQGLEWEYLNSIFTLRELGCLPPKILLEEYRNKLNESIINERLSYDDSERGALDFTRTVKEKIKNLFEEYDSFKPCGTYTIVGEKFNIVHGDFLVKEEFINNYWAYESSLHKFELVLYNTVREKLLDKIWIPRAQRVIKVTRNNAWQKELDSLKLSPSKYTLLLLSFSTDYIYNVRYKDLGFIKKGGKLFYNNIPVFAVSCPDTHPLYWSVLVIRNSEIPGVSYTVSGEKILFDLNNSRKESACRLVQRKKFLNGNISNIGEYFWARAKIRVDVIGCSKIQS